MNGISAECSDSFGKALNWVPKDNQSHTAGRVSMLDP